MPEYQTSQLRPSVDDPLVMRNTFARFPTGVVAISARVATDEGFEPQVIIASSFQVGISFDPPLALFAVQHSSTTWPRLRAQDRVGVSVLGAEHAGAVRQLASRNGDRFAGVESTTVDSGAVFIDRAPVWLECSVHGELPAGDHDIVLLRVHATATADGIAPLVFHQSGFHNLEQPAEEISLARDRSRQTSRYWVGPWSAIGQEALVDPERYHPATPVAD